MFIQINNKKYGLSTEKVYKVIEEKDNHYIISEYNGFLKYYTIDKTDCTIILPSTLKCLYCGCEDFDIVKEEDPNYFVIVNNSKETLRMLEYKYVCKKCGFIMKFTKSKI